MMRSKSIALRTAALTGISSFILLLCISVGLLVVLRSQQSRDDIATQIIAVIADAVRRDDHGRLHVEKTPRLQKLEGSYPSLSYLVSDGQQSVAGGVEPTRLQPRQVDSQEPTYFMRFELKIGKQWSDGLSASRDTQAGPVSIQVNGLPEERLPVAVEALAASAMLSVPLFIILATAGLSALSIMPRLIARPVERTASAAEAIDGVPNGRRLPVEDAPRELKPLIVAFNSALERIDLAASAQRAFLANAAHELRTPLTRLRSHLDVVPPGEARAKLIADVHHLSETVTMLLQLARLTGEPPRFELVDLVAMSREVVAEEVPSALAEGVEIELVADEARVLVRGSETAIRIALVNVLRNAVGHSGSRAPITVQVDSPGSIIVIDHGCGIPEDMREEFLRPFVRGQTSRDGIGLGLTIVAQVMSIHAGKLIAEETPGGGATFELRFTH